MHTCTCVTMITSFFYFLKLQVGGAFFPPYMGSPIPSNSMTSASTGYSLPYYSLRMEVCETFDQGYPCARGDHCLFSHPGIVIYYIIWLSHKHFRTPDYNVNHKDLYWLCMTKL